MTHLNENHITSFGDVTTDVVLHAADKFGTPIYLYDESVIIEKCQNVSAMPNAFGLSVRYAIKAHR